jgi:hypothetical protein
VFYIAGEGHNGLVRRFAAWFDFHGLDRKAAPIFLSQRAAQFLDADSARSVTDAVDRLSAVHGTPALIQVDTVARNFGGGDENSNQEMGRFIAAMDDLKARYPGCVILLHHHTGHMEKGRARGASALQAALDVEFVLERTGNVITMKNTKMKDAEPAPDMAFAITQHQGSAILIDTALPAQAGKSMSQSQRLGLASLKAALSEHSDGGTVSLEQWRAAFYARHTGDSSDAKKKAFQRVREALVERELIEVADDRYGLSMKGYSA